MKCGFVIGFFFVMEKNILQGGGKKKALKNGEFGQVPAPVCAA